MKAVLATRKSDFAIIVFPVSEQVDVFPVSEQVDDRARRLNETYVLYPQRRIRQICDDLDIPVLDLTKTIHENGGTTLCRDYLHLNAKGNDVISDELERYLPARLENVGYRHTPGR